MKIWKKLAAFFLLFSLSFVVAACGQTADTNDNDNEETQDATDETVAEESNAEETTADGEREVLKFGTFATTIQPILADQLGYFEEELADQNVKIELETFDTGPAIKEALEAGELTFGSLGAQPTILANNNGTDLRIFGTYKTTEKSNALLARKDAGINDLPDLKGKKIGYTAGSTLHNLLLKILDKAGLTETDAELYPMDASEIITSLQTGDIDAGMLWEPYITQALKNEDITEVVDGTGLVKEVCGYNARKEFLDENPEIAGAVLQALDRAQQWSEENEAEAVANIAESSGSAEDEVQAIFDKCDGGSYISQDKIDAITDTANYLHGQGLIEQEYTGEELVDTSVQESIGLKE